MLHTAVFAHKYCRPHRRGGYQPPAWPRCLSALAERTRQQFNCRGAHCVSVPRQRPLAEVAVVARGRLSRRAPVAARDCLRLATACWNRTTDTGGHTGHPYTPPHPAGLRPATSPKALRALGEALAWCVQRRRSGSAGKRTRDARPYDYIVPRCVRRGALVEQTIGPYGLPQSPEPKARRGALRLCGGLVVRGCTSYLAEKAKRVKLSNTSPARRTQLGHSGWWMASGKCWVSRQTPLWRP